MKRLFIFMASVLITYNAFPSGAKQYKFDRTEPIEITDSYRKELQQEYSAIFPSTDEVRYCMSLKKMTVPIMCTGIVVGALQSSNYGEIHLIHFVFMDIPKGVWEMSKALKGPEKYAYEITNIRPNHTISGYIYVYSDGKGAQNYFMYYIPKTLMRNDNYMLGKPSTRSYTGQKIGEMSYKRGERENCNLRVKLDRFIVDVNIDYREDIVNGKDVDCVAKLIVNKIADKFKLQDLLKEDKPDVLKLNKE